MAGPLPIVGEPGVNKPRALDLFCGAGGATCGLQMAGFDVTGIDHRPQPRYVGDRFIQADALNPPVRLADFDLIWASPPCQASSILRQLPWLKDKLYPQLIPQTLDILIASGVPWVIEIVPGAPISGVVLCGQSFGLPCYRHRIFQTSFFCLGPPHAKHRETIGPGRLLNDRGKGTLNASSARGSWGKGGFVTVAGHQFKKCDGQRALDIDWMTRDEMAQAIPPAYSEFIGLAALRAMGWSAAA